jgi:hypothetical protein
MKPLKRSWDVVGHLFLLQIGRLLPAVVLNNLISTEISPRTIQQCLLELPSHPSEQVSNDHACTFRLASTAPACKTPSMESWTRKSSLVISKFLDLRGYLIDGMRALSNPRPTTSFTNDDWKREIMEWEKMIRSFKVFMSYGTVTREIDLGLRHPQLGPFLICIFGGKMFEGNGIDSTNMVGTYIEHFLVWTGRISPLEARLPILETVLGLFFM